MISSVSTTALPAQASNPHATSGKALAAAASTWFAAAVAGQMMFAAYIIAFYWGHALRGNMPAWNKVLQNGYIPGDTIGNAVVAIHILIAAVITIAGPLQLIPAVRARLPRFHKWNGRVYLVTVVVASLSGLFAVWSRVAHGGVLQQLTISGNAVLILVASWFTLRHALARELDQHRRWALRLFLVVSGSWFFRVLLMFWLVANRGPVGFDPVTFQGPALVAIGVLQYLLPLAILELYFKAKASASAAARLAIAGLMLTLTAAMAVGIAVAAMGMWLPLMR